MHPTNWVVAAWGERGGRPRGETGLGRGWETKLGGCNNDDRTAADMTTRCAFKIEDPSRGPGRVDFTAPDEGFGLEGTPKPKIQRDPSPQKGNLICGPWPDSGAQGPRNRRGE